MASVKSTGFEFESQKRTPVSNRKRPRAEPCKTQCGNINFVPFLNTAPFPLDREGDPAGRENTNQGVQKAWWLALSVLPGPSQGRGGGSLGDLGVLSHTTGQQSLRAVVRLSEWAGISDRGCVLWGPALSCRRPVREEACTLPVRCPQPWVTLG